MFDPTPRYPWTGNAWQSSPNAETAVPLAPNACLLIVPGGEGFKVGQADANRVEEINLRSYGWAEHSIFGSREQVVYGDGHRPVASHELARRRLEHDPVHRRDHRGDLRHHGQQSAERHLRRDRDFDPALLESLKLLQAEALDLLVIGIAVSSPRGTRARPLRESRRLLGWARPVRHCRGDRAVEA